MDKEMEEFKKLFNEEYGNLKTDKERSLYLISKEKEIVVKHEKEETHEEYMEKHYKLHGWNYFKDDIKSDIRRLNRLFNTNIEADHMYLSAKQYLNLLYKIKKTINEDGFRPSCYDSNTTGDKYTESNCGICNDNYCELETALFKDQFPERKSMKYTKSNQKCPFDMKKKFDGFGCFYHCYLFKTHKYEKNGVENKERMLKMVLKKILDTEQRIREKELNRIKDLSEVINNVDRIYLN